MSRIRDDCQPRFCRAEISLSGQQGACRWIDPSKKRSGCLDTSACNHGLFLPCARWHCVFRRQAPASACPAYLLGVQGWAAPGRPVPGACQPRCRRQAARRQRSQCEQEPSPTHFQSEGGALLLSFFAGFCLGAGFRGGSVAPAGGRFDGRLGSLLIRLANARLAIDQDGAREEIVDASDGNRLLVVLHQLP